MRRRGHQGPGRRGTSDITPETGITASGSGNLTPRPAEWHAEIPVSGPTKHSEDTCRRTGGPRRAPGVRGAPLSVGERHHQILAASPHEGRHVDVRQQGGQPLDQAWAATSTTLRPGARVKAPYPARENVTSRRSRSCAARCIARGWRTEPGVPWWKTRCMPEVPKGSRAVI